MKQLRVAGDQWCELKVELENGRLSISGSEGRIVKPEQAKREALDYWTSFFADFPDELVRMRHKFGKTTPLSAARYVLRVDGKYHGLDTHREDWRGVFLTESAGQIQETLVEWFPEVVPYLKWHLNTLHAECEHQEALGWTYDTHPMKPCPTCGHKLGSGWARWDLPAEVVAWAQREHP